MFLNDLLKVWKKNYKYITSLSKNAYIDRLDGIVNKYNNEYHTTYIDKLMIKILNLKLVILLEY